jgi:hypothetical protein
MSKNKENKNINFVKIFRKAQIRILLVGIVLFGAVNYGSTAVGFNLIQILSNNLNQLLNKNLPIDKIVYIIIALCGLLLAVRRTTWLPFLSRTVFPESLVPLKNPKKTDMIVKIKTKPNRKVAYWAALPKPKNTSVMEAYDDFSNAGVVMSNNKGVAELPILTGSDYLVPFGKKIPRHVHYRIFKTNGIMGKIKTHFY